MRRSHSRVTRTWIDFDDDASSAPDQFNTAYVIDCAREHRLRFKPRCQLTPDLSARISNLAVS